MPDDDRIGVEAPAILLVDDEESILSALKRVLRREGYRILACSSGVDAMSLLEESGSAIGVVVSDFRMPGMNGVEFLSRVRAYHPATIRIILSGYADAEMVQSAINQGEVYRFVSKPWDDEELKATIRASIQQFEATRVARSVLDEVTSLRREMKRLESTPGGSADRAEPDEASTRIYLEEDSPEIAVIRTLQGVLNAVPAGLVGVDCDDIVTFANPYVSRVFGIDRLSIIGNSVGDVLATEIVEIARTVAHRGAEQKSALLVFDGQSVKVNCVPLGNTEGGRRRGVLICGFITGERV
ncbi:MAG: response regulator [Chloroflexota bacterium]